MSSRSTSSEPRSQLTMNLDPRWEFRSPPSEENTRKPKKEKIPGQRLEENKEKKKKIPDQRSEEKERIIRKGLRTRQFLNNTKLSQANKKRKETTTGSGPLPLITNQNLVCRWLFRPALNKNRKGQGQNTQSQISHKKNTIPEKFLLIRDHTCNLWFDRKWFAKSSHDISMVRN